MSRSGLLVAVGMVGGILMAVVTLNKVPASAATQGFEPGAASASSRDLGISPAVGSLSLGVGFGESLASYTVGDAKAQSRAIDLGAVGLTLTTTQCDGTPAPFQANQLPVPVQVDSRQQGAATGQTSNVAGYSAQAGALPIGVGSEQAKATPQPLGSSLTTSGGLTVPSLTIGGGTSTAVAQLTGHTRHASATSDLTAISLGGGAAVLTGLHWAAEAASGDASALDARFTVGSVTLVGVTTPVTPTNLPTLIGAVNAVLAPTGLRVDLPVVTTAPTKTGGTVAIGALQIVLANSPLGHTLLSPVITAGRSARQQVIDAMLKLSCKLGTFTTLVDAIQGAVAGGGSLSLEVGGATATTDGSHYDNPLGGFGTIVPGGGTLPATIGTQDSTGTQGPAGTQGPTPPSPPAGGAPTASAGGPSDQLAAATRMASIPAHRDRLVAVWAGVIALLAVIAIAAADELGGRRRRRIIIGDEA